MFRASSCPSSGAQLQSQPLVYRWNVVVAVLLVVVGPVVQFVASPLDDWATIVHNYCVLFRVSFLFIALIRRLRYSA